MKEWMKAIVVCGLCMVVIGNCEGIVYAQGTDTSDAQGTQEADTSDAQGTQEADTSEEPGDVAEPGASESEITGDETRVLFVGNSFTRQAGKKYGVDSIFQELGNINGRKLSVTTIAHGAAYLSYYAFWSANYHSYYEELLAALQGEAYDYIILQDQTCAGVENYQNEMLPAVKQIAAYVYTYQPQATLLLYETAAYEDGTKVKVNGVSSILDMDSFQNRILYGYTDLSNTLSLAMVPAGMKAYYSSQVYPEINLVASDSKHPSYAGYYLTAACFYYEIFSEIPQATAGQLSNCDISDIQLMELNGLVDDTIEVDQGELKLSIGESETLEAFIGEATAQGVLSWKSLDPDIAAVDEWSGMVTGVAEGETAVVAETSTGLMAVCCVTVEESTAPTLSFGRKYYQVKTGDTIRLEPKVTNWNPGDLFVWSTSNSAVAAISSDGTVTAKKMGSAVIKVRNKSDRSISASYTIYVSGATPSNVTVEAGKATASGGTVSLSWDKVYGAVQYEIYRYDSTQRSYTRVGTSNTNSYLDQTAQANVTYYYKVSATAGNAYTESSLSKRSAGVLIPSATTLSSVATKKPYARITWKRNTKASGYVIYRSEKKSSGYKQIAVTSTNTRLYYWDKNVKKGKTYYYRIKSYKKTSTGTYYSTRSNTVAVKISK